MDKTGYLSSIGKTPLTRLDRISALCGCDVFAKQERCNPSGSVKDRVAWYMVRDAIERGILKPGSKDVTIIEPTSGNTGIGLAAVGTALKIPVCIVMPDSMSLERRKLMSIYDAKLILTPGANGMRGAIEEAERIMQSAPGRYFMPMQFKNPANARAHFETTGPEIASELGDKVDYWVAGVGTGGTLTGAGRFLKQLNPELKVIAAEPATSAIIGQSLRGEPIHPGPHGIQGIGANFIPDVLDMALLDGAIGIETAEAILQGRELLRCDAISTGISGGCNIAAILELARGGAFKPGMKVVTVIPDGVEKYMSTPLAG
ncbi:MAG: cysteine synthase family protein [Proteobacteria bacterium]|nr:cysteine synthase family protein [Pseudomonadota bacterium]